MRVQTTAVSMSAGSEFGGASTAIVAGKFSLAAEGRHRGSGQSLLYCVASNKSGFKTPHFKKDAKKPTAMRHLAARWRSHFADGSF